ncbi:MAG: glutathione S-transferase family protein [Psychrobium sp.]
MITVHHLNQSRSMRVIWLLEELGLDYEVVNHQRDPQTMLAPESLKQVHPLAKAPVVIDGNTTLCESGAVLEYLLDQAGDSKLRPAKDAANYYHYLEWLHFAEGSLSLPVISSLILGMEERTGDKPMDGYIAKELALDFAYIESRLATNAYFAGEEFTAADVMMTFLLQGAKARDMLTSYPHTLSYLKQIEQRKAYLLAKSYG